MAALDLLTDVDGEPLDLSTLLEGGAISRADIVPGTERRWAQSHSAALRVQWSSDGGQGFVFLKRTPADPAAPPRPNWQRDAISCRAEARFYAEFAPVLRERGVRLPRCHAVRIDPRLDALHDGERAAAAAVTATSSSPPPPPPQCGGTLLVLECLDAAAQHSPLSRVQALRSLTALARFHAAAWEDAPLLARAAERLHLGGGTWWSLQKRDAAELDRMVETWPAFLTAFGPAVRIPPPLLSRSAPLQWSPHQSFVSPLSSLSLSLSGR